MRVLLKTAYLKNMKRAGTLDGATEDRIMRVSRWLTSATAKKGLLLVGGVGNGKTTMLYAMHDVLRELSAVNIYRGYRMEIFTADKIVRSAMNQDGSFSSICSAPFIGIDDVGTESSSLKVYGTEYTPTATLIQERYKYGMKPTIITTNLTMDGITQIYGERVSDRLREMCDVLVYESKSFRR